MAGLAAFFRLMRRHFYVGLPLALAPLSSCVTTQPLGEPAAAASARPPADPGTELTLAKLQVRLLLLQTQLDAQTAARTTAEAELQAERTRRVSLDTAYARLAAARPAAAPKAKAATRQPAAPNPAALKATQDQLRQQTSLLESTLRTSRDSVSRRNQQLQQAQARLRTLEQAVADRDRTIGDLRQRLTAAVNKDGMNLQVRQGKMHVTLPDEPIKSLLKSIF